MLILNNHSIMNKMNYNNSQKTIFIKHIKFRQDNYIWIIIKENKAIIIDPGDALPVIEFLSNHDLKLIYILITHNHEDHIKGVDLLYNLYSPIICKPEFYKTKEYYNIFIPFFDLDILIINTPGHTSEDVSYYCKFNNQYNGVLFCGDTLFSCGCGRIFSGNIDQLFNSLQIISNLPLNTKIFCAHEYTLQNIKWALKVDTNNKNLHSYYEYISRISNYSISTLPSSIKTELSINPFLRTDDKDIIKSVSKYINKKISSPKEVFKILREWKNDYKN